MKTRETVRYGFACGKVRVLETRVFGRGTYERLLDAPTFADQRRLLSDTPYGRYLEGVETADGVERALIDALDGFYAFLDEAALPDPVVRFFRVRHDFELLRGALKSRALGIGWEAPAASLGTVDPALFHGPSDELPEPFREASILAAAAVAEGAARLGDIDSIVDRALFAELGRLGRESKSGFLAGLADSLIDVANAKVLIRARRSGLSAHDADAALIPGGTLTPKAFAALYPLPIDEIAARLAATPAFSQVPADDIADPARIDIAAENAVVRYLRRARTVPVGPEPVIAYVFTREAEVAAVRTALIGKLQGLDPELLRGRFRDLYL